MDAVAPPLFVPPKPPVPAEPLPMRQFLRAIRTNALTSWPSAAYQQPMLRRRFFGRTNLLLNAPDDIHHVLVENPSNYRRTPASIRILRPIVGQGLLLSEGETWKLQRRTIAPALAPRVMPLLARHIVTTTDEVLEALRDRSAAPVDMLAEMQRLTLEIAGRSMFSLEMHQYGAAMRHMLTEYAEHHARPHLLDLMLPPSIPSPRDFGRRRFQARWMRLIESIMHERLHSPPPDTPRDLFDLLRTARDPETGAGFSAGQLRDQVATLILAGHETTAVALFWAMTLLAQAPEEQQRLADEVAGVTITPDTAMAAMTHLPHARAVLSETLRLFPSAFVIVREAIGADRLGNHDIRRLDVVMIAPWVLHRHQVLWRDADAFDPSRFLPDAPPPPRFAYLPFGAGPRICVGAQFALTEATLVLAAIIDRFQVSIESQRPVLPVGIITTQPDHAPSFRLRPRAAGRGFA